MSRVITARTIGGAALLLLVGIASAQPIPPQQRCQGGKNQAAGKYADCRQTAEAKFVMTGDPSKYGTALAKCSSKLSTAWERLEQRAATQGATCPDEPLGEAEIETLIGWCTEDIATALAGGGLPDCPTDLAICESDRDTCESDRDTCQSDLAAAMAAATFCRSGTTYDPATGKCAADTIMADSATPPSGYTLFASLPLGTDAWLSKASVPTARAYPAAVAANGRLYVLGGWGGEPLLPLAAVEEYDPVSDTWATKASMPTARSGAAAVALSEMVYVLGGWNGSYLATVEMYDPATDTWTAKTPMPTTPRADLAVAALNGKIYAVGGYSEGFEIGGHLNTVEEYDPAADTWSAKASMPTARGGLAATAIDGKVQTFGGLSRVLVQTGYETVTLNTVEEYDPATDTWSTKASMPTPRGLLAATAANGKAYVVGGERIFSPDSSAFVPTVEEYNPTANTWATRAALPVPRSGLAAASLNNRIYAVGGFNLISGGFLSVEQYDPSGSVSVGIYRRQ